MNFKSLNAAKNFINQQALAHVQKSRINVNQYIAEGRIYAWCLNLARLQGEFVNAGYNFYCPLAQKALEDAQTNGYILEIASKGVIITTKGLQHLGNW